jgi:ribosome-associated toxin RatA of RatAB toxin-antitoxin module
MCKHSKKKRKYSMKISKSALVSYSAKKMFDLVNDIEKYPEFLDGCTHAKVIEFNECHMKGELAINKMGIIQNFTTSNELVQSKKIKMTLVDGPFSNFYAEWHFTSLEDEACKIAFEVDFKIRSKMKEMAMSMVIKQISETMVNSFVTRAKTIYG